MQGAGHNRPSFSMQFVVTAIVVFAASGGKTQPSHPAPAWPPLQANIQWSWAKLDRLSFRHASNLFAHVPTNEGPPISNRQAESLSPFRSTRQAPGENSLLIKAQLPHCTADVQGFCDEDEVLPLSEPIRSPMDRVHKSRQSFMLSCPFSGPMCAATGHVPCCSHG